jgi:hypothetical protein
MTKVTNRPLRPAPADQFPDQPHPPTLVGQYRMVPHPQVRLQAHGAKNFLGLANPATIIYLVAAEVFELQTPTLEATNLHSSMES